MIIRLGMAPRLPETSFLEFQNHWKTSHADAAKKIPGILGYTQNHALLVNEKPVFPYPGFDACSELIFLNTAEMDEGFSSEEYLEAVRADEDEFVDKSRFSFALLTRRLQIGERPDPSDSTVKLLTLFRTHPSSEQEVLVHSVCETVSPLLAEDNPLAIEVLVTDHSAHEGRQPAAADLVLSIWFADIDKAWQHLKSSTRDKAELALAGLFFGRADLMAKEIHVVRNSD